MMICESVECRPCIVKGCKCLFHRWVEHSEIVPPSPMVGGHGGGELRYITALIECENGTTAVFERSALPKSIKEGDVLRFDNGSCYLNAEETEKRRQKIQKLMSSLFE